jgi:hypothetical protein
VRVCLDLSSAHHMRAQPGEMLDVVCVCQCTRSVTAAAALAATSPVCCARHDSRARAEVGGGSCMYLDKVLQCYIDGGAQVLLHGNQALVDDFGGRQHEDVVSEGERSQTQQALDVGCEDEAEAAR